jgi:integrase
MGNSKAPSVFRKPHADFPLYPHATGRWAKKVRGKLNYFGKCADDPKGDAAIEEWLRVKDDLLAGRTPRAKGDGLTIRDLCNQFLTAKLAKLDGHEISHLTFADYKKTTDRLIAQFGKTRLVSDLAADDFTALRASIGKTRGVVALGNEINRCRVVFKFAVENRLITSPPAYGSEFKRPTRKALRRHRGQEAAKHGEKLFSAAEIKKLLDNSTPQLKAMILLGINCGFGNNDCATLPIRSLDLDGGWVNFPRPKTGVARRCPLWRETIAAVKAVLAKRRTPKDAAHAHLVFITAALGSFAKETTDNPISKEFSKLTDDLSLKQKGRGFYSLRHTFRTIAGNARDLEATRAIMGHVNEHVEEAYIHDVGDDRLTAVVNVVRSWLYAKPAKPKSGGKGKPKEKATDDRPATIKVEPRKRQASADYVGLRLFVG